MNTITKLVKRFSAAAIVALSAFTAQAQDEPALTFSGTVDTYFKATPGFGSSAPGTAFTAGTGFSMGMINLVGTYEGEKTGLVADVVFGPRGQEAAFGAPTGLKFVNQMYGYWNVSDKVTLTLGQWNTYLGYEVISPASNFHYSTSYMFSWGPFSQAGLKANIALSDKVGLTLAFMNPTDVLETNTFTDKYTAGLQLSYSGDAGGVYLNARYGDYSGELFQVDLTGGYDLSESFYLGFNATLLDDAGAGFMGGAIYPKLTLSESFALGARAEYFAVTGGYLSTTVFEAADTNNDGIIGVGEGNNITQLLALAARDANGDANVMAFTVSGNYSVGNLTLIPEVRFDMASEDTEYAKTDASTSGTLPTMILAAVFSF